MNLKIANSFQDENESLVPDATHSKVSIFLYWQFAIDYIFCILFNFRVQMWVLETLFGITGPPTGTTVGSADQSSDLSTSSTWILLVGQTMKYIYSADTQLTCQALILKHCCSPWGWTSWMWPCQIQWQVWFQNTEKIYTGATSVNLLKCRWEH